MLEDRSPISGGTLAHNSMASVLGKDNQDKMTLSIHFITPIGICITKNFHFFVNLCKSLADIAFRFLQIPHYSPFPMGRGSSRSSWTRHIPHGEL